MTRQDDRKLYRVIQQHMIQDGRLTSSAFLPRPNDRRRLSVYNGNIFTAQEAFEHFSANHAAIGVVYIQDADCEAIGLSVEEDNKPFLGHASIVFEEEMSNGKMRKASTYLAQQVNSKNSWDFPIQNPSDPNTPRGPL